MDGVALWPGVALHAVMAIWCAASFGIHEIQGAQSAAHNGRPLVCPARSTGGNDYVMSHLARAVVTSGEVELDVDLLSGRAQPPPLLAELCKRPWPTTFAGSPTCCGATNLARGGAGGNYARAIPAGAATST